MTAKLLAQQLRSGVENLKLFDEQIAKTFAAHPDAKLFSSLCGAGAALAPRLLCVFGSDRDRWDNADQIASLSGIAPITRQSGRQRTVSRRYACPKYLRQTFRELADHTRCWCKWTSARY